jgi:hypothetical protein
MYWEDEMNLNLKDKTIEDVMNLDSVPGLSDFLAYHKENGSISISVIISHTKETGINLTADAVESPAIIEEIK